MEPSVTLSLKPNWGNDILLSMSQFETIVKPFDLVISKTTKWLIIFKHNINYDNFTDSYKMSQSRISAHNVDLAV